MVDTETKAFSYEFDPVEKALEDFGKPRKKKRKSSNSFFSSAANKFVIVMDNEDRENEGDLIIAAQNITTEQMAFLIRHSR